MPNFPGPLRWILLTGLILRLGYFLLVWQLNPAGFWATDSGEYWRLAENLLGYGEFSQSNGAPFQPDHFRLPLYPLLLSFIQFTGGGLYVAVMFNILLGCLTIYFSWKAALLITGSHKASGIAAMIIATDIPSIVFGSYVLTETLFTMLLLAAVYYFIKFFRQESKITVLLFSAALLGLSMLTRPVSLFIPVLLAPCLLFDKRIIPAQRVKRLMTWVITVLLVISPWLARNYITFGKVFYSTAGEFMLAAWHAPNIKAQQEQQPVASARYALWSDWYYNAPYDAYQQPLEYSAYIRDQAVEILREEPWLAFKQHITGVIHLLVKPARGQLEHQLLGEQEFNPATPQNKIAPGTAIRNTLSGTILPVIILAGWQLVVLGIVYLTALPGLGYLLRKQPWLPTVILLIVTLYLINMVVPPVTYSRFRVPVMPCLAVLAGAGIVWLREWRRGAP